MINPTIQGPDLILHISLDIVARSKLCIASPPIDALEWVVGGRGGEGKLRDCRISEPLKIILRPLWRSEPHFENL